MTTEEQKKIRAEAKKKASDVLSQEDDAKMKARLEELFSDAENDLALAIAAKDKVVEDNTKLTEDLEGVKSEKEALEQEKAELEAKAEELNKKLSDAEEKLAALESEVESMKQEAALQLRVSELEEAGLMSNDKLTDKRIAKIKAMDDEEFADYKADLEDLKASWVPKNDKSKDNEKEESKSDEKPKTKKSKKEKELKEDDQSDSDDDQEDSVASAAAALEELANLDIGEDTKIDASTLIKLKKAAAGFNIPSQALASLDEDDSNSLGIDSETMATYQGMWDEEE